MLHFERERVKPRICNRQENKFIGSVLELGLSVVRSKIKYRLNAYTNETCNSTTAVRKDSVSYCQFVSRMRVLIWSKEARLNSGEVNHKEFMKEVLPDLPCTNYSTILIYCKLNKIRRSFKKAWLQSSVDLYNAIGDTHLNTVTGSGIQMK